MFPVATSSAVRSPEKIVSKQSNEVAREASSTADRDKVVADGVRSRRPNRDLSALAMQHADSLGISPKVSDGLRKLMLRYDKSPISRLLETMHDRDAPEDAKDKAAEKLLPYLHSKIDAGGDDESPDPNRRNPNGPTLNLTLNVRSAKKKGA